MRLARFKPVLYGHTTFLGFVCVALVGVSLWLMFSSHDHLEAISQEEAQEQSNRISRQFEEIMFYPGSDSLTIKSFVGSARMVNHLAYLVIADSVGAVVASYNELSARRAAYQHVDTGRSSSTHIFGYRVNTPVIQGNMYVGIERTSLPAGLQRDSRLLTLAGWAILVVALFLVASMGRFHVLEASISKLRRARRDLVLQKGSLESEVHSQREKELQLKQSEERYKSLLETTMESAFKDLERQKKNLEKEVEEKTATQKALRRSTRRLRVLNSIERKIVDEEPIETIVEHAVDQLQELLKADRISVLQLDEEKGIVTVQAERGSKLGAADREGQIPTDWYRPFKKGLFVARNLSKMSERFPIEERALERGIQSYCRVTLTSGESIAGALHVGHSDLADFDEEYLKVVRDVADILSIALRQHVHQVERQRFTDELISERDRAEEMARLKTAFLANMTHEIRTPLSGIIGFAQVLEEELDDKRKEFAMHIQSAGKRLMATINSVLDLSRLQADKASLALEKLDAGLVVMDTLRMLQPLAERKDLDFRVSVPESLPAMLDGQGLEIVVNNLVGNAIKFTENGFVSIKLDQEGDDLRFTVADSGAGISEDFIPMLFDEFRQEHMGTDRPAEGSGLGLAITLRVVQKMNGRIDVKSSPGKGSTFVVVFEGARGSALDSKVQSGTSRPARKQKGPASAITPRADATA